MKISIVSPNISSNGLGRALVLAEALSAYYDVEIVGPAFGESIWGPANNYSGIKIISIPVINHLQFYLRIPKIVSLIDGDIIIASKPLLTSYLISLLAKGKRPLVLDIDDWEMGFLNSINIECRKTPLRYLKCLVNYLLCFYRWNSELMFRLADKLIPLADSIIVSNSYLHKLYGGLVIPHGRDAKKLDPEQWNMLSRKELTGVSDNKKIVMFLGTVRLHKGVEELIEAISLLGAKNVILVLVGLDDTDKFAAYIKQKAETILRDNFLGIGIQPLSELPKYLSIADIMVIPQRETMAGHGQIPAKLFDAMAMAKAIVATDVSDMKMILGGCGWIVSPDNPQEIATAIKDILDDPEEAKRRGACARKHLIEEYSTQALGMKLHNMLQQYNK